MTWTAFSFLFTGVLLNAVAQLLLKAGTNVLGVITLTRDNWADELGRMAVEPHFIGGVGVLRHQPGRMDHRPVARPRVDRVPDAVARLRHQRHRRALPARRIGQR